MILLAVILLTGCVTVKPEQPVRVTGYADLPGFRYEQQILELTVSPAHKTAGAPVIGQRAEVSVLPYYFDFELPRFMASGEPLQLTVRLLRAGGQTVEAEQEQPFSPGNPAGIILKPVSD
ncbi:hypothetical protein ACISK3_10600 [Morganella morganii]